jgi:hypothetical protein
MKTYETSATVGEQGQVRVTGVPFEPGTTVAVTVRPTGNGAAATDRAERLLAALDKARNLDPVGPLRRGEIYDRNILH